MLIKTITSKDNKDFKFFKKVAENKVKNFCLLEGEHLILAFAEKFGEKAFKYLICSEKIPEKFKKNFGNLVEIRHNLFCSLSNLTTPSEIMAIVEIPENNSQQINLHCDSVILD